MLVSRRDFAIACATAFALAMLAGCSNSHSQSDARPSASALPSSQQEGAPYPADMANLSQIPSLRGGLEDIDLRGTSNPWNCGLGQTNVLFECPFGGQGVGKVGGWWRLGRFDGALTGWCVVEMGARAP